MPFLFAFHLRRQPRRILLLIPLLAFSFISTKESLHGVLTSGDRVGAQNHSFAFRPLAKMQQLVTDYIIPTPTPTPRTSLEEQLHNAITQQNWKHADHLWKQLLKENNLANQLKSIRNTFEKTKRIDYVLKYLRQGSELFPHDTLFINLLYDLSLSQKNFSATEKILLTFLKNNPQNDFVYEKLAQLYQARRQDGKLEATLLQLIKLAPNNFYANKTFFETFQQKAPWKKQEETLLRLIKLAPLGNWRSLLNSLYVKNNLCQKLVPQNNDELFEFFIALPTCFASQPHLASQLPLIENAITRENDTLLGPLLKLYRDSKQYDKLEALAFRTIDSNGSSLTFLIRLTDYYLQQNNLQKVIAIQEAIHARNPHSLYILIALMQNHQRMGNTSRAQEIQTILNAPPFAEAFKHRQQYSPHYRQLPLAKQIQIKQKMLELAPLDLSRREDLISKLEKSGQLKHAQKLLQDGVALMPDNKRIISQLIDFLYEQKENALALQYIKQYETRWQLPLGLANIKLDIFKRYNDEKGIILTLKSISQRWPDLLGPQTQLLEHYINSHQYFTAIELGQMILQQFPNHKQTTNTLLQMYHATANNLASQKLLHSILQEYPNHEQILRMLLRLYLQSDDFNKARNILVRLHSISPNNWEYTHQLNGMEKDRFLFSGNIFTFFKKLIKRGPSSQQSPDSSEQIVIANLGFYIANFIFPTKNNSVYQNQISSPAAIINISLLIFLLIISIGLTLSGIAFGGIYYLCFYLLSIIPVSGIFYVPYMKFSYHADHWAYLATIPLSIFVTNLFYVAVKNLTSRQIIKKGIYLLLVFCLLHWNYKSLRYAHVFNNSDQRVERLLEENPDYQFIPIN